jgi:hypothetical protein
MRGISLTFYDQKPENIQNPAGNFRAIFENPFYSRFILNSGRTHIRLVELDRLIFPGRKQ